MNSTVVNAGALVTGVGAIGTIVTAGAALPGTKVR